MPCSLELDHYYYTTSAASISSENLERNTSIRAVLKEDTTVNKSLVQVGLLESRVGNIIGTSGLLEDTNLELSLASQIAGDGLSGDLERLASLGVVGLDGAAIVSYALRAALLVGDLLLLVVESDGKVLPHLLEHRSLPEKLEVLVEKLPGSSSAVLSDELTSLELELVTREIGLLVPNVLSLLASTTSIMIPGILTRYSWLRLRGRLSSCIMLKCRVLTPLDPGLPSLLSLLNCRPARLKPSCFMKILLSLMVTSRGIVPASVSKRDLVLVLGS